jgi:hypothetical protein
MRHPAILSFATRPVVIAAVTILGCAATCGTVFYSFTSQENRYRDRFSKNLPTPPHVDQNCPNSK